MLELTVAIVELGILAALAVPTFDSVINGAKTKTATALAYGRDVQTNMSLGKLESAAADAVNADGTLQGSDLGSNQANVVSTGDLRELLQPLPRLHSSPSQP